MFKNSSGEGKIRQSIKRLWRMCWVSDHSCEEAVFRNSGDLCRKQPNVQLIRRVHLDTPVFLPGESQGQRSLVGGRLWDHTESDMTEAT